MNGTYIHCRTFNMCPNEGGLYGQTVCLYVISSHCSQSAHEPQGTAARVNYFTNDPLWENQAVTVEPFPNLSPPLTSSPLPSYLSCHLLSSPLLFHHVLSSPIIFPPHLHLLLIFISICSCYLSSFLLSSSFLLFFSIFSPPIIISFLLSYHLLPSVVFFPPLSSFLLPSFFSSFIISSPFP